MSKLTSARASIPIAKPGCPPPPLRGRAAVIKPAAALFLDQGARAAQNFLGGSLRAETLLPAVFARAKYLVRCAKRLESAMAFQNSLRQDPAS